MDWLRNLPIGQYVADESSWLRRIDPRLKISWVLFFLLTPVLASPEWRLWLVAGLFLITFASGLHYRVWFRSICFLLILCCLVGLLAMILPASEPTASLNVRNPAELPNAYVLGNSWNFLKLGPVKFFNTFLGPLIVDRRSAELGLKTSTLIFTVVHSVNLMLITSTPEDLVWALRWFLNPLTLLRLPIDRISFQLLLALRFIPLVQEEFQNLLRSVSTRAVNFKKLGFKASFALVLSVGERLLSNILLRAEQGADALVSRNGALLPPHYFKPKSGITKFSTVNIVTFSFLVIALILRGKSGYS
tara:strand:- start:1207 stop:2118 length:912 start_codon:yes stop_codon:yes gene_type:complete